MTSDTPSMRGVAALPAVRTSRTPNRTPSPPRTILRRRRTIGGSGRFLIAVAIVIVLTRQAENATTTRVNSTPSAKAMSRLCHVNANSTWRPASSSSAPNALAIA